MFVTDADLYRAFLISSELDLRAQNPGKYGEPLSCPLQPWWEVESAAYLS